MLLLMCFDGNTNIFLVLEVGDTCGWTIGKQPSHDVWLILKTRTNQLIVARASSFRGSLIGEFYDELHDELHLHTSCFPG